MPSANRERISPAVGIGYCRRKFKTNIPPCLDFSGNTDRIGASSVKIGSQALRSRAEKGQVFFKLRGHALELEQGAANRKKAGISKCKNAGDLKDKEGGRISRKKTARGGLS